MIRSRSLFNDFKNYELNLAFYGLLIVTFVVYIPVSTMRSSAPLVVLDILLGISLAYAILNARFEHWFSGWNKLLSGLVLAMLLATAISLISSGLAPAYSHIAGIRSIFFFIVVLYVASTVINSPRSVDLVMKVLIVGALFAAIYGFRQVIFGMADFELERLAKWGNIVGEISAFGRTRASSTFGDPWMFTFSSILGIFAIAISFKRNLFSGQFLRGPRGLITMAVILILAAGTTFTRTPLVGLIAGFVVMYFVSAPVNRRWLIQTGSIVVVLIIGLVILNWIVVGEYMSKNDNSLVHQAGSVLDSVWSILPSTVTSDPPNHRLDVLQGYSADARISAIGEASKHVLERPAGGMLSTKESDQLPFSVADIGVLRYGIEIGWLGLFAVAGIWISIMISGIKGTWAAVSPETRILGKKLISVWVAFTVLLLVTPYLHVEAMAAWVAVFGAALLNLNKIDAAQVDEYR